MDVIYFFSDAKEGAGAPSGVRVPLLGYNKPLFKLLMDQGGAWDKAGGQVVFRHGLDAERFAVIFKAFPCVRVDEGSPAPPKIFGFFNRPIEKAAVAPVPATEPIVQGQAFDAGLRWPSLPDKFPEHWQIKLDTELRSRKYSAQTRRSYQYYNRLLCRILQKAPEEIDGSDIKRFLAEVEKEYSASSMNLSISAIKFFYENVLKNQNIDEQRRPRHDGRLPMILSREEIGKILHMESNPKHRLLLMLAYSSGLRVSEVVALKREHIDLDRKVVYVRLGKGRKDRYTLLSEKAAKLVAEYCANFGIKDWLFPGVPAARHLSIRSAQHIFDKAARRAEVAKRISIHSLRHAFATHLLESGTDIRYIQELLGHSSVRTTERYTHVARRSVLGIQSPLDSIS